MNSPAYARAAVPPGASFLARYSDLLLVAVITAIVAMLIVPLAPLAIDTLVAANIAFGVVLLLVSVYIRAPLEFSSFPSVLLISTLFRLALSIATTKQILQHGQAGHIIDTFGHLVAGGNLVVGLVVFLIITAVQFIVIAKGAERVAEVAARFSLDAMPGKQLSIDSDLRSGLIDKDEARRRRRQLELESKLHGSLDGAMKFVKGDAIAGIVIIVVNLLGGLAIGVLQNGMPVGAAMLKYSILTIGDGMVAQIPALLGAMAAGLIVTRTTDEERDRHLGEAIGRQLTAEPRVLLVAGGLCLLLAAVPGFPAAIFVLLGLAGAIGGVLAAPHLRLRFERRLRPTLERVLRRPAHVPSALSTAALPVHPAVPLLLEVPRAAVAAEAGQRLMRDLEAVLADFQQSLGLVLPRIGVRVRAGAGEPDWRLFAFEVPIAGGMLGDDPVAELRAAVRAALRHNAAMFIGIQETSALLTRASADLPEVVKEVLRALTIQRVAEILKRLVEEEVPIRNLRDILEALADAAQREKDVHALCEFARIAIRRQLCHRAAPDGTLRAVLIAPDLEEHLRRSVRVSGGVQQLALDPAQARALVASLLASRDRHQPAAIVTAVDIRRHVRKLIEPDAFDLPVLSFHEIVPSLQLDILERVTIPDLPVLEAA